MKCKVCGNQENNTTYEAREMMFGMRDSFTYFQCAVCHCLQIAAIPHNLYKYYPQDYHSFELPSDLINYYSSIRWKIKKVRYGSELFPDNVFHRLISGVFPLSSHYKLLHSFNITLSTRLLDVGCGTGYYIYPLFEIGLKQVHGIDPFIESSFTYPNGLQIEKKYIHEMSGQWDIIIYNHSFEHVPDPLENLLSVSKLLSKEGVCILRIPTVSSFAWQHYRTNWYQLDAPRHLFLHSIESIRILADKAGMQLSDVLYDSGAIQFIGSEKYLRDIPSHVKEASTFSNWIKRKWLKSKYKQAARRLNREKRGDQAAFILRKK